MRGQLNLRYYECFATFDAQRERVSILGWMLLHWLLFLSETSFEAAAAEAEGAAGEGAAAGERARAREAAYC